MKSTELTDRVVHEKFILRRRIMRGIKQVVKYSVLLFLGAGILYRLDNDPNIRLNEDAYFCRETKKMLQDSPCVGYLAEECNRQDITIYLSKFKGPRTGLSCQELFRKYPDRDF